MMNFQLQGCATCFFWVLRSSAIPMPGQKRMGTCHAGRPQVVGSFVGAPEIVDNKPTGRMIGQIVQATYWPEVGEDQGCGEYKVDLLKAGVKPQ